ncbi:MAG: hypothetical protein AAF446_03755, partial [Pseudomonadota bacterium]
CGIDVEQTIECWGSLFAGAGLPPPSSGWTGVASTRAATAWSNPSRPGWIAGFDSDQTRTATDYMSGSFPFLFDSPASCGLRDGEFRCAQGTDRWGVPEGPWRDVAVTSAEAVAWCGIRETGLLECASRLPGSQLSNVPVGTFQQISLTYDWFNAMPQEQAVALAEAGSLVCWSTAGLCSVPAGNDFIQITDFTIAPQQALRVNGELVNVDNGSSIVSEVFDRFDSLVGYRSDNTIGWWVEPGRPVPAGSYRDVILTSTIMLGPGSVQTTANACGVRTDGGVDCWEDTGGMADIVFSMPGNYRQIHSLVGLNLTDAAGIGQTFAVRTFGNALKPAVELATSFSAQCMIDLDGQIGCKGASVSDSSPINLATGDFRGMAMENELVCAINEDDRVRCWDLGDSVLPMFPDEPFSRVAVGVDHACAITASGGRVVCNGNNPFQSLPAEPFPAVQGQYRDLATSAFGTCVIDPDGKVECFGPVWIGTGPPNASIRYEQIEITAFTDQFCLIDQNDQLECFRRPLSSSDPEWISFFSPNGAFQDVAITSNAICALGVDGVGRCWGIEATLAEWNTDGPRI